MSLLEAGLAPGTWRNKNVQLQRYVAYMNEHEADPMKPTQYDLLSYMMHLSDSLSSPGAVLNYISGARTWVRTMSGDTASFDMYSVALMKKGIQRSSKHVSVQAPPLTPYDVKTIVRYLESAGDNGLALTAGILIAYFTLLRQSNLFAPESEGGAGHALLARDISITDAGLNICVRTTKTRWRSRPPLNIQVPAIPRSPYCPARAWRTYASRVRPHAQGPAFVTTAGFPLRASAVTAVMHAALIAEGHPHPRAFTLHSLRRGGAQACAQLGVQLDDIRDLGTWTSQSVHSYVPKNAVNSAPRTLSTIFA